MKKTFHALSVAMVFATMNPVAFAEPIIDRSLIVIEQFDLVNPSFASRSTDSFFSNTFASMGDVQAFGNLTSGTAGSRVIMPSQPEIINNRVTMYDTLDFNTGGLGPVEVDFELVVDGALAASSEFDSALGQGRVDVYDITGLDTWLETESFFGAFDQVEVRDDATEISTNSIVLNLDGITRDGILVPVSDTISGSFIADPSKTYGIAISSFTSGSRQGVSDFLGTSAFAFTNLNGATFTSDSGVFLTIPEPGSLLALLWGSGIYLKRIRARRA